MTAKSKEAQKLSLAKTSKYQKWNLKNEAPLHEYIRG